MRRREFAQVMAGLAGLSVLPLGHLRRRKRADYRRWPSSTLRARRPLFRRLDPDQKSCSQRSPSSATSTGRTSRSSFASPTMRSSACQIWRPSSCSGRPDVLYTFTSGGARAAAGATTTIPIVVAPVAEETMAALVPDFAQPPGNITGLTLTSREQREKCLQLFKEAVPGIRRVGVLSTRSTRSGAATPR